MVMPFTFPDWVPSWLALLLVALGALIALAYLGLPFAVYGVKGRLAALEARLDEIQGEIRSLALRLPERHDGLHTEFEPHDADPYETPAIERARTRGAPPPDAPPRRPAVIRPPIPPARYEVDELPEPPGLRAPRRAEGDERRIVRPRTEPRFDPRTGR